MTVADVWPLMASLRVGSSLLSPGLTSFMVRWDTTGVSAGWTAKAPAKAQNNGGNGQNNGQNNGGNGQNNGKGRHQRRPDKGNRK